MAAGGGTARTASETATTLGDLFLSSARTHSGRPALWVCGDRLTYHELQNAAARLAAAISAVSACRGGTGRQCALLVDQSLTAYASVLGALLAGVTYVPLDPRFPTDRLRGILDASEASILIVDRGTTDMAKDLVVAFPRPLLILLPDLPSPPNWAAHLRGHGFLCRGDIEGMPAVADQSRVSGDAGAYLLFTSGSTGAPKGVLIRHRNALAYIRNVLPRYRPTPQDRFTQLFSLSFDLSVHDMFVCWGAGACLYRPPANALAGLRDFVRRHELTFWFSVPSTAAYMSRMRMLQPGSLPSLRVSLFCGEALPTNLARMWKAAAPNSMLENLYGPTEATIAITAYRLPDGAAPEDHPTVPLGRPFPGQQIAVVDTEGHLVADGEPGELYLAGSQIADGYWRLPAVTAQRFAPPVGLHDGTQRHWYRTGDRVVMHPGPGLLFLGRLDHQTKIRGYRIDLQEIETVVRAATGCESVAALAWPPDEPALARRIVVFIAGEATEDDIIAQCELKLPPVMVPHQIRFVPDWPLTANGKTDYAALKQRLKDALC